MEKELKPGKPDLANNQPVSWPLPWRLEQDYILSVSCASGTSLVIMLQ